MLGSVIHSLIGGCQSAFIKGWQILDRVLIASEVVEAAKKAKAKAKATFLKLDFCKAFDSVDWGYLMGVMEAMGFGSKWIGWIRNNVLKQ